LLHAEKSEPLAFARVPCTEFKVRNEEQKQNIIAISKLFTFLFDCPVRLFSANIFQRRGKRVLQMRTSALFGAKKLRIFRNSWCGRTDRVRGRIKPIRHFLDKEVNFSRFSIGRILWTALNESDVGVSLSERGHPMRTIRTLLVRMRKRHNFQKIIKKFGMNNFIRLHLKNPSSVLATHKPLPLTGGRRSFY